MFDGATKREDLLRNRVGDLENDHTILDAIRNLANDERYRPHVVAIDNALTGASEEIAEAKATGDESAIKAAEKRFADKAAQLENLIAEQNAEGLWDAANAAASQMLQSLPDEYTDVDKARLSQLWTPRVNWDHIEDKGRDSILPTLKESFAQLIRDYGQPQGAVAKTTRDEVLKSVPAAAAAQQTPEQRIGLILGKDWSETGEKGAVIHSDADFAKSMADLIRVTRGG
jgi:ribosomal protein L18